MVNNSKQSILENLDLVEKNLKTKREETQQKIENL